MGFALIEKFYSGIEKDHFSTVFNDFRLHFSSFWGMPGIYQGHIPLSLIPKGGPYDTYLSILHIYRLDEKVGAKAPTFSRSQ